jgi:formiminotetrahydrofolate cyclodeaminase
VAQEGNVNSVSDAGTAALMLHAASEAAALNVRINLNGLTDTEFVGWKSEEVETLLRTSRMMLEEAQEIVASKMQKTT